LLVVDHLLLLADLRQIEVLADQIAAQERYLASLNITLQRATALYRHGAVSYRGDRARWRAAG
jgi:hypothetical protein